MRNLHVYADLPGDDDQETNRQIFEKDDFFSDLTECDMFDLWKKYDLMEAAVVYCEEIHHAMWTAYHEDTVVVHVSMQNAELQKQKRPEMLQRR